MAIQALESGYEGREDIGLSRDQAAVQLGGESVADVIPFPLATEERPGMAATMAFVNWIRDNNARGYGIFGIAEFKHDENGLFVDHHGPKVYLTY